MTKVSKSTVVLIIALAFVFASSGVAFAGGKGGGSSSGAKSNTSLNFTKIQTTTYTSKTTSSLKGLHHGTHYPRVNIEM